MWAIIQGLFLDVPRVIDYSWRHAEYRLNAECAHQPSGTNRRTGEFTRGRILVRRFYKKPAFWFFAITVFFASYGPNWHGLCAIGPHGVTTVLRKALAVAIIAASVILAGVLAWCVRLLIKERFEEVRRNERPLGAPLPWRRRATCYFIIYVGLLAAAVAGIAIGWFLWGDAAGSLDCVQQAANPIALWQLAACIAAVVLFAWLTSSNRICDWWETRPPRWRGRFRFDVIVQFILLAVIAIIQWFVLSNPKVREVYELPYRHVFLLWAPCIAAVMAVAPWWAGRRFRGAGALRQHFQNALQRTELFVQPVDPALSGRGILYAMFFAPVNHIPHLLLFPALVAIAVPEDWLNFSALLALGFSFFLVVWGNMSPRWQEVNTYIERWFLRGAPLVITVLVIVIAILRIVRVEYISTLLDAIPFGTVFGLVVMNYVLFWLAEYWMSRAVALELLRLLAPATEEPKKETYVDYLPDAQHFDGSAEIHVDRKERYLAIHGTGRFVVLGNVQGCPKPCRAFQSYYLTETFALLDPDKDSKPVAEIVQRTGTYFLGLNIALIAVAVSFWAVNAYWQRDLVVQPVVREDVTRRPTEPVDLSKLLEQGPGPVRPAIVVVGSGGGTRAALYSENVLRGLHRLGVDSDVVLLSGVSGGGVAAAYFAANKAVLTGRGATAPSKRCSKHSVEDEWDCFTANVTQPFIEDVLNGATEWRIFTNTSLSALLAESFERDLFGEQQLGSVRDVALILNATIVSHPAEASAGLTKVLNPPADCDEADQVFKIISGGRLIFTNLRDVDAFKHNNDPDRSLPDVRLPYHIVRDPTVRLARAAALNANFPPVFPAAGVQVHRDASHYCRDRLYYATDGGAEENLGLISALYALESALDELKARKARAKPIHVVIADASALDYDYSQDRALSLLVGGGPSARLAGGLTRELRARVDARLRELNGASAHVRYHFLGLPLAFRSRGGFGTHWLFAHSFQLHDPRVRKPHWYYPLYGWLYSVLGSRHDQMVRQHGWLYSGYDWLFSILGSREEKITIGQTTLEDLWSKLHDPKTPFCSVTNFNDEKAFKVQWWICSPVQGSGPGRDLHMAAWQKLVKAMERYQNP